MAQTILRLHVVDGKLTVTFFPALTGEQYARLYTFARAPVTKRALQAEIQRVAHEWGLKVELDSRAR